MNRFFAITVAASVLVIPSQAQAAQAERSQTARTVVRTQDDLPRYSYPVPTTATALLAADHATFNAWAAKVIENVDDTLARFDIQDHASLRDLLGEKLAYQVITHQDAAALATSAQIRALQDKPEAKLMSGLMEDSLLNARISTGQVEGAAYEQAFAANYAEALGRLPWAVVANSVKEAKSGAQILTRQLVLGIVQQSIEPAVAKSHAVDSSLAAKLLAMRYALVAQLPLSQAALPVLTKVVAANDVAKPDIWAARDIQFTSADKLTPVVVGVWDTGSDLSVFPHQTYTDPQPKNAAPYNAHGLSFDLDSRPASGFLLPLSAERAAQYSSMLGDLKGFSDLQASIDSHEADELKHKLSALPAAQVPAYLESLKFFDNYVHGTHVAGIIARGDPAVRLAVARITFDYRNVPEAPTDELIHRGAASYQTYVDWFRTHHVRVVNMSWGGTPRDYENALQLNGIGKDAAERKALARHYFEIDRDGLLKALKSAPDILFVCAAGNSDSDNGFDEFIPSSFVLPNLLVVGAVDRAGDEASFTSYGKNVAVDANGYQVTSFVPGGHSLMMSGTSMASPNTVNLAAKLLALDPKLTPSDLQALIVGGATASADGRRHNIDAKASLALLKARMR